MPYLANIHTVGCLPENVETFDTAEDAWEHLVSLLGDDAWEPDNENDPDGPQSLTYLALKMQAFQEANKDGCVYHQMDVYEVEWIACDCRDLDCPDH